MDYRKQGGSSILSTYRKRNPFPSLLSACWGRWREAPDGVWPAAADGRRLAGTAPQTSIVAVLLSTPHPALRATFPDFAGKGERTCLPTASATPSPACWGRWPEGPDGVWPAATDGRRLAGTPPQTSIVAVLLPHPIPRLRRHPRVFVRGALRHFVRRARHDHQIELDRVKRRPGRGRNVKGWARKTGSTTIGAWHGGGRRRRELLSTIQFSLASPYDRKSGIANYFGTAFDVGSIECDMRTYRSYISGIVKIPRINQSPPVHNEIPLLEYSPKPLILEYNIYRVIRQE